MWRILYLITELNIGGAENALYQLVTSLDKKKYSPTVVSLTDLGRIGERLKEKGINVLCIKTKGARDFSAFFRLVQLLREKRPHILHTFLFHANFIGRIAGKLCRIPIIISSVRVMEMERAYHIYLNMLTHWMVDKEVCVAKEVERFVRTKAYVPTSKLITIYNGVNPTSFDPLDEEEKKGLREELSISSCCQVVGTIARLTLQKGTSYLLKAFERVHREFPHLYLLIVGKGEKEDELKRLSKELGISSHVKFLGFREDAHKILNLMDIFVLPSLWEGMPNAVLEAQALGKAVIASWVGGNSEIIIDGETGFLTPPRDWWSLAECMRRLLKDAQLREEFGRKGKERVLKNFTVERMVSSTENLYQELIKQRRIPYG